MGGGVSDERRRGGVSEEYRMVHFNTAGVASHRFCNNKIRTAL